LQSDSDVERKHLPMLLGRTQQTLYAKTTGYELRITILKTSHNSDVARFKVQQCTL
jgi:hypothetical protein